MRDTYWKAYLGLLVTYCPHKSIFTGLKIEYRLGIHKSSCDREIFFLKMLKSTRTHKLASWFARRVSKSTTELSIGQIRDLATSLDIGRLISQPENRVSFPFFVEVNFAAFPIDLSANFRSRCQTERSLPFRAVLCCLVRLA
jgi:hypothetical protein